MHFNKLHFTKSWFLIVNPSAGNTNFRKSWICIQSLLKTKEIFFSFAFTQYTKHELVLVDEAIKQGYRNFISVGGDGTLHHVVNGIMMQRYTKTSNIKLGVIPLGTGNDWIRTYKIPNSIEKAINVIINNTVIFQDIGCITLASGKKEYFNNLAGIGYDGYVVKNLKYLKKIGSIAFLLSGLYSLLSYRKKKYSITIGDETLKEECLMIIFGICKYSGGGLRVTKYPNPTDGLLDITIVKKFSFFNLLFNLPKLYNGNIVHHKKVDNYKVKELNIINDNSIIEADGEIVGTGSLKVHIIPNAIQFLINCI
ncbi:diacylglycerol kinase family lipid kinase [Flavobacteriaceae bacterium]|jgi:YegS/Rv2252/BmrU family lipid kinase|nr:diacylglycerol kinase family lipid kinase [Flavobacteriaceae bacterium]